MVLNKENINSKEHSIEKSGTKIVVATYDRRATKDDTGVERKQKLLQRYCDSKGYKILKSNVDNGYSGNNLNRPALQEMLRDVQQDKIKKLIVLKMSVLSRDIKGLVYLYKELQKYNCEIETVEDNIDMASPNGKLFIDILESFIQMEHENRIKISNKAHNLRIGDVESERYN